MSAAAVGRACGHGLVEGGGGGSDGLLASGDGQMCEALRDRKAARSERQRELAAHLTDEDPCSGGAADIPVAALWAAQEPRVRQLGCRLGRPQALGLGRGARRREGPHGSGLVAQRTQPVRQVQLRHRCRGDRRRLGLHLGPARREPHWTPAHAPLGAANQRQGSRHCQRLQPRRHTCAMSAPP